MRVCVGEEFGSNVCRHFNMWYRTIQRLWRTIKITTQATGVFATTGGNANLNEVISSQSFDYERWILWVEVFCFVFWARIFFFSIQNWVTRDYKKHNIPTTAKENSLDQIHTMCQRIKVYVDMLNAVKSVSDVSSVSPSLEQRRTLETSANTLFTAFSISTSTLRWYIVRFTAAPTQTKTSFCILTKFTLLSWMPVSVSELQFQAVPFSILPKQ